MLNRTLSYGLIVLILCTASSAFGVPTTGQQRRATLTAVGDVLFARGVGKQIVQHGNAYPFSRTRAIISRADIAFCNLECTLSDRGICRRSRFRFRASPSLARSLSVSGFDVVSLANNHTLDYGRDAMLDTAASVRSAGMVPVGAGRHEQDARRVSVIERHGLRVGFVAYTDIASYGVVRLSDRPTIAGVNTDELPAQIREAKSVCDVLVVSFHWGAEYMRQPTERQRLIAHLCIDNGADLILGHHPHVLQPVEVYGRKPIIYSMGGFVWDSKLFRSDLSAIYEFTLAKSSAALTRTIPISIRYCRPAPR